MTPFSRWRARLRQRSSAGTVEISTSRRGDFQVLYHCEEFEVTYEYHRAIDIKFVLALYKCPRVILRNFKSSTIAKDIKFQLALPEYL